MTSRSDVVFALLEQNGELAALFKRRRLWPYAGTPLVIWSVWFAERLSRAPRDERRALARNYLSCDLFVHMAEAEKDILIDSGFSADQLMVMTYGVADQFYSPPDQPRDIDIVAIGQDLGRDYATLFRAVQGTELHVELVCQPINIQGLDLPANVNYRGTVSHTEYADLLRRAKIVVVPTHDLMYPTGSSVALEAAASGAAIVVTDTPAMRTLFTPRETALMVGVGDDEGLREALKELSADHALRRDLGARARRSVETRFNPRVMWGEIDEAMHMRGILSATRRHR
ncbi:glycosyltransferase [Microbacterium sp. USTB-Y]|uniref:glycosyltransferase family protein n=1 Tax=Microbacterium sp. USTB-Y TaxID=2823692 RepID=UPI00203E5EB8|nr:glycosyltransferase [Microbacterium sp. USTB-Y]